MNKKDTVTKVTLEMVSNDGITRSVSTNYLPSEIANEISRMLSDWKNNTIGTVAEIEEFNEDLNQFIEQPSKHSSNIQSTAHQKVVYKEIYKFLDKIADSNGHTITEHTCTEACELMNQMKFANILPDMKNTCDICGSIIDEMNFAEKRGCIKCSWSSDCER
jgi:hypothetical protein